MNACGSFPTVPGRNLVGGNSIGPTNPAGWRVKKKLLGRKILSVMKLEGEKWRVAGGPVAHAQIPSRPLSKKIGIQKLKIDKKIPSENSFQKNCKLRFESAKMFRGVILSISSNIVLKKLPSALTLDWIQLGSTTLILWSIAKLYLFPEGSSSNYGYMFYISSLVFTWY